MILVDHQISDLCDRSLITPCDRSLINPASLDVRIGESAIVEYLFGDRSEWSSLNLNQYSKEAPYWLQPKEFILVGTLETVNIPTDIGAEFRLKSSRAREGWNQCLAIWLDPGFSGVITLELINECRYTRLPLYPGLLIGQLIFHSCGVPDCSYKETGRYNGATTVEASKG
ncbi:dCTP deaminase [Chroococcidiopsis sp.]|uniref:dCTP deaminase n=1 Tax=Chroococcidiopsis sp. TaxID=3088168 RepID=UPI003F36E559